MRGNERIDLRAQIGVETATIAQPRTAPIGIEVERMLEHVFDLGAPGRGERHGAHTSGSTAEDPRSASAR